MEKVSTDKTGLSASMLIRLMSGLRLYQIPQTDTLLWSFSDQGPEFPGGLLVSLEAKSSAGLYQARAESVEDEYFVSVVHEMTKSHYISHLLAVSPDRVQMVRLFPEGPAEARFRKDMVRIFLFFSPQDGLFYFLP